MRDGKIGRKRNTIHKDETEQVPWNRIKNNNQFSNLEKGWNREIKNKWTYCRNLIFV